MLRVGPGAGSPSNERAESPLRNPPARTDPGDPVHSCPGGARAGSSGSDPAGDQREPASKFRTRRCRLLRLGRQEDPWSGTPSSGASKDVVPATTLWTGPNRTALRTATGVP